jgi:tetratricopeptide (TPR) repeat protein
MPLAGLGPAIDVGLSYPDSPTAAAENVTVLWRGDLDELTAFQRGGVDPAAWNEASLRWLVDPGRTGEEPASGTRIGIADVERFKATVGVFVQLDNRFGGGNARQALIQHLNTDGQRLLRGRYTAEVGRGLFSAVAEATLLAAWMTYDSAPESGLAQRYFIQALALAQAADDRLLGGSILDAMSHQATYLGRFQEAANLARAARAGTAGRATPTLTAHFHAMEARALARLGDARACDLALAEAVRTFERRNPDDDPDWIKYVDEAELAAELGHCFRDLGRPDAATQHASQCLGAIDETTFQRSDFFATMVLADASLAAGEAEQACAVALQALTAGEQIRSARCVRYLRDFHDRLTSLGEGPLFSDFQEQARGSRLWRIASRPQTRAS